MFSVIKAILKVCFFFIKENILLIKPKERPSVYVVTDISGNYLVKVFKNESGAVECCRGMEEHYKYEKYELQ